MKGFEVVTSDDCRYGQVVEVQGGYLIVEHGSLRKSKYAVPETFAHADDSERLVRLSVSKEIVDSSPKLDGDSLDRQAVAEHYGLAEAEAAPATEGEGNVAPDDPARSADQDAFRAGRETADQERARIRGGGLRPSRDELGSSPGLLGDRAKSKP
ncbi:MAG TPA: hypothetical protein VF002_00675 [Gaiellaceae bacterium]